MNRPVPGFASPLVRLAEGGSSQFEVMAGIYIKKGTRNLYCCYTGGDGRKVHRSTRERTRKAAVRVAVQWEQEAELERKAEGLKQLELLKEIHRAGDLARRGSLGLDEARDLLAGIVSLSSGETIEFHTARGWCDNWVASKDRGVSDSTVYSYQKTLGAFLQWLGDDRSDRGVEFITTADIVAFRDSLREKGLVAKTCNFKVRVVRMCLAEAVRRGVMARNPAEGVRPLQESDSRGRVALTGEEVEKLLLHAEGELLGLTLLGAYGGLRIRDAALMRWEDVDFERKLLTYIPMKTRSKERRVVLPLHERLEAWFLEAKANDEKCPFVFASLHKLETGSTNGLSAKFGALLEKAGIDRDRDPNRRGAGSGKGRKSFHSLRHFFITSLTDSGVPEDIRMALAGHSGKAVHRGYSHANTETLREAVGRLSV